MARFKIAGTALSGGSRLLVNDGQVAGTNNGIITNVRVRFKEAVGVSPRTKLALGVKVRFV